MKVVDKIRNRHMIHGGRYVDDLEYTVKRFEKALKEINEKCVYYDGKGWALNPDTIGDIVIEALDI